MFGVPALRSEDPRFLRGEGRYLENIADPGCAPGRVRPFHHAARAVIGMEGVEAARSMPGVAAVFTADDLRSPPQPSSGNVEGSTGTLEAVPPRGARPGRGPVRGRAGRGGRRGVARARRRTPRSWCWPDVRAPRGGDGRGGGGRRRRARCCSPTTDRTSRRRSSRTGTTTRWRAPTSWRAAGS